MNFKDLEKAKTALEPLASGVEHLSSLQQELLKRRMSHPFDVSGYPTSRWPVFNEAFGGFRPGELVVVTAETGHGKSTFCMNWLMDAVSQGIHGLLISLEERWISVAERIGVMVNRKPMDQWEDADVGGVISVWNDLPLWRLNRRGNVKTDVVFKAIRDAVKEKEVKFVIVDHMDYIRRPAQVGENESAVIQFFMQSLGSLIEDTGIGLVVVAHPKKTELRGIKRREINMDEVKGSSSIKQTADAVFSIFQPNEGTTEMWLRFQKIRHLKYSKSNNAVIRFGFDPETLWFHETSTTLERIAAKGER